MDFLLLLKAVVMGIIEGLTEFLPVSSTGHLIVAGRLLNLPENMADTFEIFIQLGAVIAVIIYFAKDLIQLLGNALKNKAAQRLLVNLAIAFVPAAAIGFVARDFIKTYLFSPVSVALALIVGGIIMLIVERRPAQPRTLTLESITPKQALGIGIAQIASLWSGFSRSASTLIGGLLAGLDRPTALKFSFYLAIPILGIAGIYDLYKSRHELTSADIPAFGVGLIVSFIVSWLVIRFFLGYVARRNLIPFAWYRIVAGVVILAFFVLFPV